MSGGSSEKVEPQGLTSQNPATLHAMSPEAQRIAIAEACGWKWKVDDEVEWDRLVYRFRHNGMEFCHEDFTRLPDYLSDLNAMHSAEKVLTNVEQDQFVEILNRIMTHPDNIIHAVWLISHATAAQRAEALLRTLGKWEEKEAQ